MQLRKKLKKKVITDKKIIILKVIDSFYNLGSLKEDFLIQFFWHLCGVYNRIAYFKKMITTELVFVTMKLY